MPAKSPKSGHELSHEESVKGGKAGKRGVSWKTAAMELAEMGLDEIFDLTPEQLEESIGKKVSQMTLKKAVLAKQYESAIIYKNTQAAAYLRDTVGEKPTQSIDLDAKIESIEIKWPEK